MLHQLRIKIKVSGVSGYYSKTFVIDHMEVYLALDKILISRFTAKHKVLSAAGDPFDPRDYLR